MGTSEETSNGREGKARSGPVAKVHPAVRRYMPDLPAMSSCVWPWHLHTLARGGAFCIGVVCAGGTPINGWLPFPSTSLRSRKALGKRESGHRASGPPLLALWGHEVLHVRYITGRDLHSRIFQIQRRQTNPHAPPGRYLCAKGIIASISEVCSTSVVSPSQSSSHFSLSLACTPVQIVG